MQAAMLRQARRRRLPPRKRRATSADGRTPRLITQPSSGSKTPVLRVQARRLVLARARGALRRLLAVPPKGPVPSRPSILMVRPPRMATALQNHPRPQRATDLLRHAAPQFPTPLPAPPPAPVPQRHQRPRRRVSRRRVSSLRVRRRRESRLRRLEGYSQSRDYPGALRTPQLGRLRPC